ncbi:flagellar hook protein, partial [Vibrio parahaemolyticus AQ3810]
TSPSELTRAEIPNVSRSKPWLWLVAGFSLSLAVGGWAVSQGPAPSDEITSFQPSATQPLDTTNADRLASSPTNKMTPETSNVVYSKPVEKPQAVAALPTPQPSEGVFGTDKSNFVTANNGAKLQGYSVDSNNNLMTGSVGNIQVSTSSLNAKATDKLDFVANFDASAKAIDKAVTPFDPADPTSFNSSYTTQVYDSLGNSHTVTQYFTKTADNAWEVNVQVDGGKTPVSTIPVTFNKDGTLAAPTGSFNVAFPAAGANAMSVDINLKGSTQFGAAFGVSTNSPNGYTSGELAGVRVEDNGMVYATYTNGQSQLQGQVVLADFANTQGLAKVSGTA